MPITDPSDLSPRLWVDGLDLTFDGSNNLTAAPNNGSDGGSCTINGDVERGAAFGSLESFRINSTSKNLEISLGAFNTGTITVFVFGALLSTGGVNACFGTGWPGGTGAKAFYHEAAGDVYGFGNGCCDVNANPPGLIAGGGGAGDTNLHAWLWQLGTARALLLDDSSQSLTDGTNGAVPNFAADTWIIGHAGDNSEQANFDFAAIVVFDYALTTQERTDLYDYYVGLLSTTNEGTAAITEGGDTLSSAGALQIQATASITEAADTVASIGAFERLASLAATEADDTVSSTAVLPAFGALSVVEDDDTLSADSEFVTGGQVNITEGDDALLAAGELPIVGAASITEEDDMTESNAKVFVPIPLHKLRSRWIFKAWPNNNVS